MAENTTPIKHLAMTAQATFLKYYAAAVLAGARQDAAPYLVQFA
jgi:hypothetical protein